MKHIAASVLALIIAAPAAQAGEPLSLVQAITRIETQGYTVLEIERDDGRFEVDALRRDGARVELIVHVATADVLRERLDD